MRKTDRTESTAQKVFGDRLPGEPSLSDADYVDRYVGYKPRHNQQEPFGQTLSRAVCTPAHTYQ